MRLVILGYGKMGKQIEQYAISNNVKISRIIKGDDNLDSISFTTDEVVIDFTNAEAFIKNLPILCKKQVPIVVGTTGWDDKKLEVKHLIENNNGALLYASNFALGVNLFYMIVRSTNQLMSRFSNYSPSVLEIHHTKKKDAPSGTALEIAQIMGNIKNSDITSIRQGDVIGEHQVHFVGNCDQIEITHRAKNREIFAQGAVETASWLLNQRGFFSLEQFLKDKYQI